MHAGNHVRAHFEHEHRQRQHGGQGQVALEFGALGVLLLGGFLVGLRAGIHRVGLVADLLDGRDQVRHGGHAAHGGTLGREVDRGLGDAGHGLECLLDAAHAGGAGHALDRQFDGASRHVVADLLDRLDQRDAIDRTGQADVRPLGGEIDGHAVHARHLGQGGLDSADAARAGHALDG